MGGSSLSAHLVFSPEGRPPGGTPPKGGARRCKSSIHCVVTTLAHIRPSLPAPPLWLEGTTRQFWSMSSGGSKGPCQPQPLRRGLGMPGALSLGLARGGRCGCDGKAPLPTGRGRVARVGKTPHPSEPRGSWSCSLLGRDPAHPGCCISESCLPRWPAPKAINPETKWPFKGFDV